MGKQVSSKTTKRNSSLAGITRMDYEYTHGWAVRYRIKKNTHSKLFSDRKLGGKRKALLAAKEYYQEMLAKYPKPSRKERALTPSKRNTSGTPGVSRGITQRATFTEEYWAADCLLPDGTRKYKRFSIKKHGERKAKKLAIAARLAMVKDLYG